MKKFTILSAIAYKIIAVLYAMFLMGVQHLSAQEVSASYLTPDQVSAYHLAPQVWSFMRYGNIQPNLYTGTLNYSIPIYTIKSPSFELPISLTYSSNGYIPNVQTSEVGLGWFLNAGGYVTREVRGMPDEKVIPYSDGPDGVGVTLNGHDGVLKGFYHLQTDQVTYPSPANYGRLFCLHFKWPSTLLISKNVVPFRPLTCYETESDLYNFQCGDMKGSFYITPNDILIFNTDKPQGEYRIDISQLEHGIIVIETADGYEYTFGDPAKLAMLDHTTDPLSPGEEDGDGNPLLPKVDWSNTWPISKIKAPDQRHVYFEYDQAAPVLDIIRPYVTGKMGRPNINYQEDTPNSGVWVPSASRKITIRGHQYVTRLKKITTDFGEEVVFDYDIKVGECAQFRQSDLSDEYTFSGLNNNGRLSKITIKAGDLIKEYVLSHGYAYGLNTNPVMFLKSITIPGEGLYSMDYWDENKTFPHHGTTGIDHWGYYNNRNIYDFDALIPQISLDANYDEIITGYKRAPNFLGARMGMLKKITYPTKGYSTFEYEGHDYSKIVKTSNVDLYPRLYDAQEVCIAGGVRIKKITDYSNATDSIWREFYYLNDSDCNVSSGNMLNFPRYTRCEEIWRVNDLSANPLNWFYYPTYRIAMAGMNLSSHSIKSVNVEYSKVQEKYGDGSCIRYSFINYIDRADATFVGNFGSWLIYDRGMFTHYSSNQFLRGRIKCKEQYKRISPTEQVLVMREDYKYTVSPTHNSYVSLQFSTSTDASTHIGGYYGPYTESIRPFAAPPVDATGVMEKLDFAGSMLLSKARRTIYVDQDSLSTETTYSYNMRDQLIATEVKNSRGDISRYETQYVYDIPASQRDAIHNSMEANFRIAHPIRAQHSIKRAGESQFKLLNGTLFSYQKGYDFSTWPYFNMAGVRITDLQAPVVRQAFQFDDLLAPGYEYQYKYDDYHRIVEIRDRADRTTAYQWNDMYMVAVGKNFTAGQVKTMIPDQMHNRPNTLSATYEYKNFFGVSKMKDPSQREVLYNYYPDGRLRSIISDEGVSTQYEYHTRE